MVPETTIPACPGNCHHACARTHHVDVVVRWWAYIDNAWLERWHPSWELYYFHFRFFHVRLGRAETQYELNLSRSIADSGSARRFDAVIVWKFDRFARSVSHLLGALETCFQLTVSRFGRDVQGLATRQAGVHGVHAKH